MHATNAVCGWAARLRHLEDSLPATEAKADKARERIKTIGASNSAEAKAEVQALQGALEAPAKLRASIDAIRADLKGAADLIAAHV